jgi:two-component system sensor histidine kinase/response regulator
MEVSRKILIIDDEEVVLDSCTQILAGEPHQVAVARDGSKGLALVNEFQPDLVFVDLKMPGISGFEVLEKIEEIDPTIVTIVITGYATVSSAVDAMKGGAYDFLPKPFTPDEFRLVTRRGLEKRALVLETMALRREKEMLRENFAAIVSHEMKSPLSAVQQNLFVLVQELAESVSADQKERLERMQTRIRDLLQVVDTWLRCVSVDVEDIQDRFAPVAVDVPIARAVETVGPQAVRKSIEVSTLIDEPVAVVFGDEGTLAEALTNVLGNAVKYSYEGSKVTVAAKRRDDVVDISVADTGIGMSEEERAHILDDFYRVGGTAEGGLGIGLAICRRIVEAHSGSMSVESRVGKGSTITMTLPVIESDVPIGREPKETPAKEGPQ